MKIIYREHAIQRMFERDISENEIEEAIISGEKIESYPDDHPYPSFLVLKKGAKPLHVVYAINEEEGSYIVITAYYPSLTQWHADYSTRRKK